MCFFGAYHDDGHSSRGAVALRCSVKVRLQFTCDLHLHVVLRDRVVLHAHKHAMRRRVCDRKENPVSVYFAVAWAQTHAKERETNRTGAYRDPWVAEDVLCSVSSLSVDLQHLSNQLLEPNAPHAGYVYTTAAAAAATLFIQSCFSVICGYKSDILSTFSSILISANFWGRKLIGWWRIHYVDELAANCICILPSSASTRERSRLLQPNNTVKKNQNSEVSDHYSAY